MKIIYVRGVERAEGWRAFQVSYIARAKIFQEFSFMRKVDPKHVNKRKKRFKSDNILNKIKIAMEQKQQNFTSISSHHLGSKRMNT